MVVCSFSLNIIGMLMSPAGITILETDRVIWYVLFSLFRKALSAVAGAWKDFSGLQRNGAVLDESDLKYPSVAAFLQGSYLSIRLEGFVGMSVL